MADTVNVILRLTPCEAEDLEQIRAHMLERSGDTLGIPRSRAALAAIRYYAAELRRRKRREPGEEG